MQDLAKSKDAKVQNYSHNFSEIRDSLECGGWKTPDTYCKCFECPDEFSAVYLFLMVPLDELGMKDAPCAIAYVGMSKNLSQRWCGHPILKEIRRDDHYVQRWFLRCEEPELRKLEADLIATLNPLWNISGKRRGFYE